MSQQYDNRNKGVLFLNDRKESETHPDRKGSINIDGKEYWISGWNKQTSKGDTISLSVKPKEVITEKSNQSAASNYRQRREAPSPPSFDDDSIPF